MPRGSSPPTPLQEKALDLLSRRRLSRGELKMKLAVTKYPESEIEALLDRFEEINLLDDEALADDFAAARISHRPMGKMLLKLELKKRLLSNELVEKTVEKAFREVKEEELAEKECSRLLEKTVSRKKIWDALCRRGFQFRTVGEVMTKLQPEDGYEA